MESKGISQLLKNKRKRNNQIVVLAKTKLNTIEVLIFKALIDSNINHDKFISVISLLREHKMKEEIINPENVVYYIVEKQ